LSPCSPFIIIIIIIFNFFLIYISQVLPMFDLVPFSPPGSPCCSNMDNNDIGALGSARSPSLGIDPACAAAAPPPPPQGPEAASLQDFFSSYSTLCDWAGGGGGGGGATTAMTHASAGMPDGAAANAKVVLPPLSFQYGAFGEIDDHPFSFLHAAHDAVAVADPWNDEQDLVARPLFGGFEDPWASGARVVTAVPYAC
jgi:hypothetical protein